MLSINWRSSAAYQHTNTIPAAGFAWEYLRRDDEYNRDFQTMTRMPNPDMKVLDQFSARWGLRFPERSRHAA